MYTVFFRKCHTHMVKFNYKPTYWSTKCNYNSYPYWWNWWPLEWVSVAKHQFSNFSAIPWREVNFQWDDHEVRFVLEQQAELVRFFSQPTRVGFLEYKLTQTTDRRSTLTHYSDSEPTSPCSISILFWCDPISARIHDLPHWFISKYIFFTIKIN
jgi:hypothetical protein